MKQVFKYPIPMDDEFQLRLPRNAELLHLDSQNDAPVLWALVEPGAATEIRQFRLAGTGHPIDTQQPLRHVGTVLLRGGSLVFHLFEMTIDASYRGV